jgi:hypothetical protein
MQIKEGGKNLNWMREREVLDPYSGYNTTDEMVLKRILSPLRFTQHTMMNNGTTLR